MALASFLGEAQWKTATRGVWRVRAAASKPGGLQEIAVHDGIL
jgi:hypothetical protein